LSARPQDRPASAAEIEAVLARAFEDALGLPGEQAPGDAWETRGDRGQRAHGLFVLGNAEEGMRVYAELHREVHAADETPDGKGDAHRPPVVHMDHKERGWVTIVPQVYLDEAEEQLREAPRDAEVLRDARGLYLMAGRLERALELCYTGLEVCPDDTQALKDAAYVLEKLGRNEESIRYLDRVLVHEPSVELWRDRAALCEAEGNHEQALWSVDKGLELEPGSAPLLIRRGNLYMREGKPAEAVVSFRQASEADPEDSLAFFDLGTALMHLSRFEEAVEALSRSVELTPESTRALNALGSAHLNLGAGQEAARCLQRAISADPRYSKAWFNMGLLYEGWRQHDKAREAYQRALEIDPGYELARDRMERLNA
jgi:tetratricopeptide (TPR) repeat protein